MSLIETIVLTFPGNYSMINVSHWHLTWYCIMINVSYGPLARYVKLRVVHAPGMPGTSSRPPRVSDHDMHLGTRGRTCRDTMPGSLTSHFLWSWWRGKRFWHSRRIHNPQIYVSDKRSIEIILTLPGYIRLADVLPFQALYRGLDALVLVTRLVVTGVTLQTHHCNKGKQGIDK